ncbi:MAG: acyltransferase [Bdellovibrio sp.]|nr:acyltransferase [Bdellovibrio sp.]
MSMKAASPYYRKDIDGLRGLAILAVVIYHICPQFLPAGFLGVDVFFVISGFLITSILVREMKNEQFKFLRFYSRRIIRLLPALTLVLFFVAVGGYFWLLPDEFLSLGKHISAASIFGSNFLLLNEVGYFDLASTKKVLLHLWSLAIEEQFYFFWPIFLWILFRRKLFFSIKSVTLIFCFLSIALFIYLMNTNPSEAFYLPFSRFWQISAGAWLATLNIKDDFKKIIPSANSVAFLSLGALFTLFIANEYLTKFSYFGHILATVSTILIILAYDSTLNTKILSNRFIVFIGLISYPLYLWHWPILFFLRLDNTELNLITSLAAAIASFVLALLTYYLIETPIANLTLPRKKVASIFLLLVLFILGGIGSAIKQKKISPQSNMGEFTALSQAKDDWIYPMIPMRFIKMEPADMPIYKIGQQTSEVLFIGDSNMEQYFARIKKVVSPLSLNSAVFLTGGGCIPIPNVITFMYSCNSYLKRVESYAASPNVKSIVVAAQWFGYFITDEEKNKFESKSFDNPEALDGIFNEFKKFMQKIGKDKKIYIVLNIPVSEKFDPAHMIKRNFPSTKIIFYQPDFLRADFDKKMAPINERLKKVAAAIGATIIDPMNSLCNDTSCKTTLNQQPIYKDYCHMTATYSQHHATFIDQVMQ